LGDHEQVIDQESLSDKAGPVLVGPMPASGSGTGRSVQKNDPWSIGIDSFFSAGVVDN
jgi:hypothetical protein